MFMKMTFPGKVVTRVFSYTLRKCNLNRTQRISSLVLSKPLCYQDSYNKAKLSRFSNSLLSIGKVQRVVLSQVRAMGALSPLDPSSFSIPEHAVVKHISMSLNVDFEKKVLSGVATLNVEAIDNISEVILDSSKLNIESVETDDGKSLKFHFGEEVPNYGSKLTINLDQPVGTGTKWFKASQKCVYLPSADDDIMLSYTGYMYKPDILGFLKNDTSGRPNSSNNYPVYFNGAGVDNDRFPLCDNRLTLKIKYSTSPEASALQWLDPNQTSGKTLPFMFSQCQPIHARSIVPCQDTPAVKFTYDAQVTAPPEFTVLMSALRGDVTANTTAFRQPMPLPSYLVAIAVGALESKYLGPRSRVWSEKESLDKSAWEFSDTERYLQAAERLCEKYQWTEYDLLVLPPSFPYGGMENPCLTFVTPTLLAGDKSLADVIVHEIMHSWTGNLVTNRNFEHFWLNEGFTVYLERKVTGSLVQDPVEAKRTRDFHSILGLQELTEAIHTLGEDSPLTQLVPDLENVHPDDSFSRVPYEKGSLFLRYLEDLLGGPEVFDEFLRSYLNNYSKKSLDTTDFKAYLYKHFKGDTRLDSVDWDTWLHKPGMPPVIPKYDTSMTSSVDSLAERVSANFTFSIRDIQEFSPQQMIYFLQKLVEARPLPAHALRDMQAEYKLADNKNAEIRFRLMRLCIKSQDQSRLDEVLEFVNSLGRMKYVRPIYRDLYAWEYARDTAIANFLKNEKYMMHVSAYTIRKDLHLTD